MNDTIRTLETQSRIEFIWLCAWISIASCVVSVVAVLVADLTVSGNDMVADTISAMAAGPDMWLAEIRIYAFAFAFIAIALGASAAHPGGWSWSGATLGFVVLGVIVFLIGFRDEYGDGDRMASEAVHIELVYALAGMLAITTWMVSRGGKVIDKSIATYLTATAAVWTAAAPVFVCLPTGYDGIYERVLGLIAIATVVGVSRLLFLSAEPLTKNKAETDSENASLDRARSI